MEENEFWLKARLIYTFLSSLERRYDLMKIYVGIAYSPVMAMISFELISPSLEWKKGQILDDQENEEKL